MSSAWRRSTSAARPGVVIAGGEPLLHRDLPKIVQGAIDRKKVTIVCTNALLLMKHIGKFKPSRFFSWSIHLDGDQAMHDKAVCQDGVFDKAVVRGDHVSPRPRASACRSTAPCSTGPNLPAWPHSWTT